MSQPRHGGHPNEGGEKRKKVFFLAPYKLGLLNFDYHKHHDYSEIIA